MSEKEKKIAEKLAKALPNMSDFDKGYILGKIENSESEKNRNLEKQRIRGRSNETAEKN